MNKGLYAGMNDEKLVEVYKNTADEGAFEELMKSTEKLRYTVAEHYLNIPDCEMDDLMSEGAMEMLAAVNAYDGANYTASFKSFLYAALTRRYNKMFKTATRQKRNAQGITLSYEQLNSNSEYEEEGDTLGNRAFSVECEDYGMVEISMVVESLNLSDRERVVVNMLMGGMEKSDIAKALGVKAPSVHKYAERIGKEMILSGAFA